MRSHIGEKFTAIVTGASDKGTWVRVSAPPVEGKLNGAVQDLEIGDQSRFSCVRLTLTGASLIFNFRETPDC
jgi:exoribonuclease-2